MLSEFECRKCGTKFLVAFKNPRPGKPVQHCVACGDKSLNYLGSIVMQETRGVGPQTRQLQSEIAAMMERVFRSVCGGNSAECHLLDAIADKFQELAEAKE